ncbi:MAG: nitronate monooxygenase [Acidobacteria bacterium]|nr:nitronate monooxygenase [Acidobacteriota bacterium]
MLPRIIQGGMGVGISDWRLARAVSSLGQLGVVSGTALDQILARRLQDGDPGGHMERALARFPVPALAARVWDTYFVPGGKPPQQSYKAVPMQTVDGPPDLRALTIVANFVEVVLAREGHRHPVGINYLEKIQIPHLPSLYGAMLGGVDVVLMGAGIPLRIPGALDRLARHEPASYPLQVTGAAGDDATLSFAPEHFIPAPAGPLRRPIFLAIVSSDVLAKTLQKKANGRVDGFIVEGPTAGGHNAPPRGALRLDERGEPIYGDRDRVDLTKLRELGLPFWLAGGYGRPERVREAIAAGAAGVQVGTAFSLCAESGLRQDLRQALLQRVLDGTAHVRTDPHASPTGFPFKVAELEGSLSEAEVYEARPRICDLGYLREAYRQPDGVIGFRCPAEPVSIYTSKGGDEADTHGRKCICNALVANIGHGQIRAGKYVEQALVTMGDDIESVRQFLRSGATDYTAADVVARLLEGEAADECGEGLTSHPLSL